MRFEKDGSALVCFHEGERLCIEPWGQDSLRVRSTMQQDFSGNAWALTEPVDILQAQIEIGEADHWVGDGSIDKRPVASITNGRLRATVNHAGVLSFYRDEKLILREYFRAYDGTISLESRCLKLFSREWKGIIGGTEYALNVKFEANKGEKIFGMGQYQQDCMDLKGCVLELAQRNSQISVPFALSSLGYGFLWNNPAVGRVTFGNNYTEWIAHSTREMDYWITVANTPKAILANYTAVTGRAGMFPEDLMGLWQCKLRYRTQEELLAVAREHKRRGLPMDAIVIDFFHWTMQGDFKFEPLDWPDPEGMVKELKELGIETVVSVWPTIDERSENFGKMADMGYLVNADRGSQNHMTWMGNTVFYDATHPGAQKYVWERCRENYYKKGIRCFWLDEAEPEYGPYDFDNYRYYAGPALQCSNVYPLGYAKGFYEGLKAEGEQEILSLVRCAWAGSQKYGVLTWSGDIYSSFRSMREQLQAGLSMSMAGIPWWTSDIGGFLGGNIQDPDFQELLVRWFAWGAFCPVFRMHGERSPWHEREQEFRNGVRQLTSGQDNEVWSFGEENYQILTKYLFVRERLRPYIRDCMRAASLSGAPVMRPLFYDFPEDKACWSVEDSYMLGPDLLVSPVMEAGALEREIYLPAGADWTDAYTKKVYKGGQRVTVPAPLDVIPVMIRAGRDLPVYE